MSGTFKYCKLYQVKDPVRAHDLDAGVDFFLPDNTPEFVEELIQLNPHNKNILYKDQGILIKAESDVLIPSGIKVYFPETMAMIALNKSGLAWKKKLVLGAQVVDTTYRGQIYIQLRNFHHEDVIVLFGSKIVQFLFVPVYYLKPEEISLEDYDQYKTERGEQGFGSTEKGFELKADSTKQSVLEVR